MSKAFLAINYGTYEGWKLEPFDTPQEALSAAMTGETYGNEWKILKEIAVFTEETDSQQIYVTAKDDGA
jgi:hypothetical protein